MATIADIAERAGVGIGTVSRVLNNSPLVSDKTRRRVLAVIEELDYTPSTLARRFSTGRTQTVGVLVPFFTDYSVVERLRGFVDGLRGSAYDLVLFNVDTLVQRHDHLRQLARRDRIDGILVVSLPLETAEVARFREEEIPLVLIDSTHPDCSSISIDNVLGGYMATRHLLDLGHRRIAFVGDSEDNPFGFTSSADRRAGYCQALQEAGIACLPDYQRTGRYGREIAHRLTAELLALPEPPTAIFAASDTQALGVLEAAPELGWEVPRQLSVVGFDDIEVSPYVGLTTIRQPLYQTGFQGARLLLEALQGDDSQKVVKELALELIVRRTTDGPEQQ